MKKLWHEQFNHLNYHSLQQLCKQNMVIGLPSFLANMVFVWLCSGKHHQDHFEKHASWHA
jgi:hypothetical protein